MVMLCPGRGWPGFWLDLCMHGASTIKIICSTCTCCDPGDMLQVLKIRGLIRQNKQFQAPSTLLHGASIYNKTKYV